MVGFFFLPSFTLDEGHTCIISSPYFQNCILYFFAFIPGRLYLSVEEAGHGADLAGVPVQDEHWCTCWLLRDDLVGDFRVQVIVFICIGGT